MRALSIAITTALALSCGISAWSQSCGAWVSGVAQDLPSSTNWAYTITNTSEDKYFTLWFVGIEVDEGIEVLQTMTPAGWYADTSQPSFIAWMCTSTEVAAGASVGGFGARFSRAPTTQSWTAQLTHSKTGETVPLYGYVAIPEPTSLFALLGGLLTARIHQRRRRG